MRVAFVGSRPESWRCHTRVRKAVHAAVWEVFHTHNGAEPLTFVSGRGRGVDRWAEEAFDAVITRYPEASVDKRIFPPNWNMYGRRAGFIRNREIVAASDKVIAFWDRKSGGTKHTILLAEDEGVDVEIRFPERTVIS